MQCDYSGLSYARLTGGSGIPWPCNDEYPDGRERLYTDFLFRTGADECGDYGHDLITGATITEQEYRSRDPRSRAILKPAEYIPPSEQPDGDYPFWVTTGRVVYQFHTRTKTARSPALNGAAPDSYVQLSAEDAGRLGIADGDMVEVESRRGKVRVTARVGDILSGHLFIPFHYGDSDADGRPRAANELTLPEWDPVSKQPHFKSAAAKLSKVTLLDRAGDAAGAIAEGVAHVAGRIKQAVRFASATASDGQVDEYLGLAREAERALEEACRAVGRRHANEPDMQPILTMFADWSLQNMAALGPLIARYSANDRDEPKRLVGALFQGQRTGGMGLLRDLHDL